MGGNASKGGAGSAPGSARALKGKAFADGGTSAASSPATDMSDNPSAGPAAGFAAETPRKAKKPARAGLTSPGPSFQNGLAYSGQKATLG